MGWSRETRECFKIWRFPESGISTLQNTPERGLFDPSRGRHYEIVPESCANRNGIRDTKLAMLRWRLIFLVVASVAALF
jgi:hypothetical protein